MKLARKETGIAKARQNDEKSLDFLVRVVYGCENNTTLWYTSCLVDCGEPKWESMRLNLSLKDANIVPVKKGCCAC
jgi:hypothetical protein